MSVVGMYDCPRKIKRYKYSRIDKGIQLLTEVREIQVYMGKTLKYYTLNLMAYIHGVI